MVECKLSSRARTSRLTTPIRTTRSSPRLGGRCHFGQHPDRRCRPRRRRFRSRRVGSGGDRPNQRGGVHRLVDRDGSLRTATQRSSANGPRRRHSTNHSIDASQLRQDRSRSPRLPTGTASTNVPTGGTITGAGPIGDAAHTPVLTYNAAGQLTAVTNTAIAIANTAVSGLGTMSTVASPAPIANGGTGQTTAAAGLTALGGQNPALLVLR